MRYILILLSLICSAGYADTTKPWTFWYWMYGAVSEEGIRADLQAMKDVGLGGCYLMPIRGTEDRPEYEGKAQQLTPEFWQMVDYAFQQADSLGLEMGIHVCDGFALAGGPWITPEESMQKVVWSDTIVNIPANTSSRFTLDSSLLPAPHPGHDGYYEDIAAFAVKAAQPLPEANLSGTIVRDEGGTFRSKEPGYIQFSYAEPQTVRSVEIIPSGNNLQAQRFRVQASNDGLTFSDIRQLTPPRQGWQNTDQNYTYALPETTARHFRFCWTPDGTEPGSEDLDAAKWSPVLKVKDIRLSPEPRIDLYESKNGSVWRRSAEYKVECVDTFFTLHAELPPGTYRVLRFGHTATGHTNATAGGGKGLECDKFSIPSVEKQVSRWFGEFKKRPNSSVVRYMHVDSWECGSQNWSRNFSEEFSKRRGYDLLPWLPVYAGIPMAAPEGQEGRDYEQVLRDIRLTINDLTGEAFFATVAEKAREYGVLLSCESVAPTMVSDGMEHYKYVDIPMGEYWFNSPTHDKPNDMLDAISGAHVYGKNIIQAEGFTEVRGVWDETPASIKPLLDRNFALGMNRLFFHVFTHNPWTDRKPGMTLDGIGLFFQRDQTWFPEAKGLVDYVTRCQALLQQGTPVVDIAVYTGEEMPRRSLTPDRLVPMLPGLFGPERIASEQRRLANEGCPMEESPVGVRHNAGILDLKDWVNPLHGYQYDSMNKDALLNRPFHYKALVIPTGSCLSKEVEARVEELRRQGVLIIDKPYTSDSLAGVPRDVKTGNDESIAYTHRRNGNTDIYFIANQKRREEPVLIAFNVSGKHVAAYDPVTGQYSTPVSRERNGRTIVEHSFPAASSSVFFLFTDSALVEAGSKSAAKQKKTLSVAKEHKIDGPWTIDFTESGIRITEKELTDWSLHEDDRIRYFSGHARYTATFKNKEKGEAWLLLGKVKDVAHVWVNGQDCGILWTEPYAVDVTKALKKGRNTLEIEVVNTWHNALRGADRGTPPYDGIWTNAKYRTREDSLLPAGLLQPPVLLLP